MAPVAEDIERSFGERQDQREYSQKRREAEQAYRDLYDDTGIQLVGKLTECGEKPLDEDVELSLRKLFVSEKTRYPFVELRTKNRFCRPSIENIDFITSFYIGDDEPNLLNGYIRDIDEPNLEYDFAKALEFLIYLKEKEDISMPGLRYTESASGKQVILIRNTFDLGDRFLESSFRRSIHILKRVLREIEKEKNT